MRDHHVCGLYVPVCDARFMRLGEALCHLRGNFDYFTYREHAGGKQLAQCLTIYQLHRDVVSGTVLAQFVDGNDIGVIEGRCGARFSLEAVQPITVGGKCDGQNLDGNIAIQARIPRPVDFAHASRAERSDDLIVSKFGAWS